MHISTISSESAFSLYGRLIEERRQSLTPEHVEMLSLIKDWEQGDTRQQHNLESKELENMTNMFMDGLGPDGALPGAAGGGPAPAGTGSGIASGSDEGAGA